MPRPIRIATAAVVTRDGPSGPEVLVVRRSPSLRFFGGYWAFPGGVVDDADHDGDPDGDDAHRRCALRELFEEVGLRAAGTADAPLALRKRLLDRETEAAAAAEFRRGLDRGGAAAIAPATPFARLTTPPFAPVLYRTRFVHIEAPAEFSPHVIEGELVDAAFRGPAELLGEWLRGEHLIAPPVIFMLEHLAELGLDRFLGEMPAAAESLEAGRLHPIRNVPGVIMAPLDTPTIPPATTTNAYVVGEQRLYVVDPAPEDPAEIARLEALLDERSAGGAEVAGVLLTHHHPDHVGGVERIANRYEVPVLAHAETLERLAARRRGLDVPGARPLGDGVRIPLGVAPDGSEGWELEALHTPGHAPGHLVFRDSRYGALLAGDLVSTVSTIVIDPPEGHLATYLASLERVRDLLGPDDVVHPAHGPVASSGRRVLERYIEHRARREHSLVKALADGLEGEDEILRRVYADVDERMLPIAARSLRAGLEKLAEEGRAEERAAGLWRPA